MRKWFAFWCASTAVAACNMAWAQTYSVNKVASTDPDTVLEKVERRANATVVSLLLHNSRTEDVDVCAHPPDSRKAFTLVEHPGKQVLRLTQVEGVAQCNQWTPVKPGEAITMRIFFPALSPQTTRIDVMENNCVKSDEVDYWCFKNVPLK